MMPFECPFCGFPMQIPEQYAGQSGTCRRCGNRFLAPGGPDEETEEPVNTAGHVDRFGAYSKASAASWEDPTGEVDTSTIPADVLQKAATLKREKQSRQVKYATLGLVAVLGFFIVIGALSGRESPETPPAAPQRAAQPARAVEVQMPATAAPVAIAAPSTAPAGASLGLHPGARASTVPTATPDRFNALDTSLVHTVGNGTKYHRSTCRALRQGTGEIHSGSAADAAAAGYEPCQICKPPSAAGFQSPMAQPPAPSYAPAPFYATPSAGDATVFVTDTGGKFHSQGCRYLKSSHPMQRSAAIASGYQPCSVCRP